MRRIWLLVLIANAVVISSGCTTYDQALMEVIRRNTVTHLASNTWLSIEGKNISQEEAWQKIVSTVAESYEVEVVEAQSGYLRTAWKQRKLYLTWGAGQTGYAEFKTQIVVRRPSQEKVLFKLKVCCQQCRHGDWTDLPRIFEEDLKLVQEIRALLTR